MWCETMTSARADGSGHAGREARPRAGDPLHLRAHRPGVRTAARPRASTTRSRASAARCCARRCTATTAGLLYAYASAGGLGVRRRGRVPVQEVLGRAGGHAAPGPDGRGRAGAGGARRTSARRAPFPIALGVARLQAAHGMPVTMQIGSPFTWAGSVIGEDRMMTWMLKKPELVHRVLDKVSRVRHQGGRALRKRVRRREPHRVPRRRDRVQQAHLAQAVRDLRAALLPEDQRAGHRALGVPRSSSTSAASRTGTSRSGSRCRCRARSILSFGREVSLRTAMEMFPEQIIAGNVDPTLIQEGRPKRCSSRRGSASRPPSTTRAATCSWRAATCPRRRRPSTCSRW